MNLHGELGPGWLSNNDFLQDFFGRKIYGCFQK